MPLRKVLPLKYRLPLTYFALWAIAWFRSHFWPKLIEPNKIKQGPLIVSGFFNDTSGIGRAGRLTLDRLRACGLTPIVDDLRHSFRHVFRAGKAFATNDDGGVWFIHANAPESLIALLAHGVKSWSGRYRIGYWAWETSCVSAFWVWVAPFFHEIWVPSRFVYDALYEGFRRANRADLIVRVHIMPHPVAVDIEAKPDRARFGLNPYACEILCLYDVNSASTRKNPQGVICAWLLAFPETVPFVSLRLKVQNLSHDLKTHKQLQQLIKSRTDISLIDTVFDDKGMASFLASFDGLISLHKSEGFGLSLAEAMSMGVTVIATGWSGNLDFMNADNSYLVDYRLIPVSDPSGSYGGLFGKEDPKQLWAEPNTASAAAALKRLIATNNNRQDKQTMATAAKASIEALNQPWQLEALRTKPFIKHLLRSPF